MAALALLIKDSTLALENKIECQAQLDIPTVVSSCCFLLIEVNLLSTVVKCGKLLSLFVNCCLVNCCQIVVLLSIVVNCSHFVLTETATVMHDMVAWGQNPGHNGVQMNE